MEFSPGDEHYLFSIRCMGIVVAVLFAMSFRRLFLGLASNKWRPILAKVEFVSIVHETDSDHDSWYMPKICYGYRLSNGRHLRSRKYSYRVLATTNYTKANSHLSGIKVGDSIKVYQNPKNPKQTVVKRGVNFGNFFELVFFAIFIGFLVNGAQRHAAVVGL